METSQFKTPDSSLVISEDVVATIAQNATLEVEGVAGMVAKSADIKGFLQKGTSPAKSIRIFMNDNKTVLDVYISVKDGARIKDVAENVQNSVKNSIQSMTGCAVTKVNVHIENIAFEDTSKN